jgi:hypothetical protein
LGVDLLFSQSAQVEDFLFVPRDGPSKNELISLSCATIDSLSGWTVWTKEESISSNGPAKCLWKRKESWAVEEEIET